MVTLKTRRLWAVAVSLLLATSPVAAVGAAGEGGVAASPSAGSTSEHSIAPQQASDSGDRTTCFPEGGYNFTIGTLGPQIEMVVHLSLLTNLGGPGTLGIELAGTTAENTPPMIELRTGVVFGGVTDVDRFLSDPFGLFAIAYEYRFNLPLGGSSVAYESDEPPVSGPVGDADC